MAHSDIDLPLSDFDPNLTVQSVELDENDLKFRTPFAMSITGPSQSGKSEFIVKLLQNRKDLFTSDFERVMYFTPDALFVRPNEIYEKLKQACPHIQHFAGLPDTDKLNLKHDKQPKLLIIDDLMNEFLSDESMVRLLSIEVHHFNISCIFTLQNFYAPTKFGTTVAKNINYKVIFYNRMDLRETRNISLQISNQPRFLTESFEFLLREYPSAPAYIVIDNHFQNKNKLLFVKSQIFPSNKFSQSQSVLEIKPIFFFPK